MTPSKSMQCLKLMFYFFNPVPFKLKIFRMKGKGALSKCKILLSWLLDYKNLKLITRSRDNGTVTKKEMERLIMGGLSSEGIA